MTYDVLKIVITFTNILRVHLFIVLVQGDGQHFLSIDANTAEIIVVNPFDREALAGGNEITVNIVVSGDLSQIILHSRRRKNWCIN